MNSNDHLVRWLMCVHLVTENTDNLPYLVLTENLLVGASFLSVQYKSREARLMTPKKRRRLFLDPKKTSSRCFWFLFFWKKTATDLCEKFHSPQTYLYDVVWGLLWIHKKNVIPPDYIAQLKKIRLKKVTNLILDEFLK